MKRTRIPTRTALLLGGLLIALLVPLALKSSQYNLVLATTVLLFAAIATAWNIIGGMGGQLDLAAGAYLGLGAFTTGTLLIRWNITPWVGMLVGGLVATGFAVLVGWPLFRFGVKEVWYALSSSALVEVLRVIFLMWDQVGGPVERYLPYYAFSLYHLRFNSYIPFYYLMLVLLLITLGINHRIRHSRLGYSLLALGENEDAAEVLGVNAHTCKIQALMLYAFLVGAMGGVYACMYGFIHPNFFSGTMSTEVAILGIVGGMGITYGPLLAAFLLVSIRELLRANLGGGLEGLYLVIYASVLIVIALYRPRGLATLLQDLFKQAQTRLAQRKEAGHGAVTDA